MKKILSLWVIVFLLLVLPSSVSAEVAQFKPIVPIPQIDYSHNPTFPVYLNTIFGIVIQLGAIMAVLMIVYGGFEYMTSAAGITKKDGAEKIRGAVTGLILLLASYLILFVINPCLVQINIFTAGNSDCSPPIQETTTTTNPQTTTTTTTTAPAQTTIPSNACIRDASFACGGTTAVPICQSGTSYTERADGAECPSAGGAAKFMCAAGCPSEPATGVRLSPTPSGYHTGACTAGEGDTERYCCADATKTNCAATTAATCTTPQVLVVMCRLTQGEIDS